MLREGQAVRRGFCFALGSQRRAVLAAINDGSRRFAVAYGHR
jgi:hypothetical protein